MDLKETQLSTLDYVVVFAVLAFSTVVGMYYAWRSKMYRTTRDFLVASGNVGMFPLILSSLVTVMHPAFIMGQPTEAYNNGIQVALQVVTLLGSTFFAVCAITPVYFQLNISTHNQYAEYRFNRLIRIVPAIMHILQSLLASSSIVYLTALILSNATGISYWLSVALICGTCTLYSSMGGFRAVIWTDVLQAGVIFVSFGALVIKGTIDVGGVSEVWNRNYEGNRTVLFRFSSDNQTNYTIWSVLAGGAMIGAAGSISSQSFLQRQMSNKTLYKAKWTILWTMILFSIVQVISSWLGLVIFARYHDCDPLLNKEIRSRDQIPAIFAKETFSGINGLMGIYIAGLLAASLSTLSSVANSFATSLVIDIVKPVFPRLKEKTTTLISKFLGLFYGAAVAATTHVIANFGEIMQVTFIVIGTSAGSNCGILMLGTFFPWTTSTGAAVGYLSGIAICWWAALGHMTHKKLLPKYMLPVTDIGCLVDSLDHLNQTFVNAGQNFTSAFNQTATTGTAEAFEDLRHQTLTVAHHGEDVFPLYQLAPIWYFTLTVTTILVVGMVISLVTGIQDLETLDPRLISHLTWSALGRLPVKYRKLLGFKSERYHGDVQGIYNTTGPSKELEILDLSNL